MSQGLKISIVIFVLTIIVVVINPEIHKGVRITSSSNVVLNNTEKSLKNQDIKVLNRENFKNTNTQINDIDKINNKNNLSVQNQKMSDYESKLMAEYRRRNSLQMKPTVYEYKSDNFGNNQPQIVLNPEYKEQDFNKKDLVSTKFLDNEYEKQDILLQEVEPILEDELQQNFQNKKNNSLISKQEEIKSRTKYEETIVWNKWKSDFHNKIHNDIANALPDDMPLGALYKYSFTIDRHGKVSNVDVKIVFKGLCLGDENEEALKKGLIAFQKSIINCGKRHFKGFPKGSQRKSVNLELVVQMGFVNVYTNPTDFNDLEKVFGYR